MSDYIDVEPDPTATAARNTANTSPTWESWAGNSEQTLRTAASSANDSVVTKAFETYLEDLNPQLKSLAVLAEKQGVGLGMGVQALIGGDDNGHTDLSPALSAASQQPPLLNRPLNVPFK